jgi:hypothetical protein
LSDALFEPIPFRRLIDEGIRRARRHFRAMYLPVALPVSIFYGVLPILQLQWLRAMAGMGRGDAPRGFDTRFFSAFAGFIGWTFLALVVQGLGYGTLVVAAVDAVAGRAVSMRRAWGTVLSPGVLATLFLAALATFGGMLFCVLPGVFLGLLFCLTLPVVVDEHLRGPAALGRSRQLMGYNPARGFGASPIVKAFLIFFAGWLIGIGVGIAIQVPLAVVQQIYMLRASAEGRAADPASVMEHLLWLQVPATVLGTLVNTGVNLFIAFALAVFYVDLRGRKEGVDLEQAVQALVDARPRAASAEA